MMVHNEAMVWDRAQQRRVDRTVSDCKCGMHCMDFVCIGLVWFLLID